MNLDANKHNKRGHQKHLVFTGGGGHRKATSLTKIHIQKCGACRGSSPQVKLHSASASSSSFILRGLGFMNTLSAHFVQVAIFIYEKSIMVLSVSMYHPLLKLSLMGFFCYADCT